MFTNHSNYWTAAARKGKVSKAVHVSFFTSCLYRNLANINSDVNRDLLEESFFGVVVLFHSPPLNIFMISGSLEFYLNEIQLIP